jgi:SAM-dependent methyltransferase
MSDTTETTDTTGPTGSANAEQREAWNGQGGDSWVRTLDEHDAMLEPWLEVLAGAAAVGPGERVLDVGCGCGTTTLPAATACGPDGTALGLDISEPMLVRARELADAAGVTNARYAVGDAQVDDLAALGGVEAYDVAISRFGVMFFDDPTVAFANIGRAVRPGGRLAMVVWTPLADQQWLTVPGGAALPLLGFPDVGENGAPGMFGLADRDATLALLADAGWTDVDARFERRRMAMGGPGGVEDALAFLLSTGVGRMLFADVEPDLAERAKDAIREALTPHLTDKAVELDGASWVLTARRPD